MRKLLLYLSLFTLLWTGNPAFCQRENSQWYFGAKAAISFSTIGNPTAVASSAMTAYEACASVADNTGNLLFYTNSETLWNKNHQVMTNGTVLGGNASCSQGALIVQNPGNAQQYYVFVLDASENMLNGGLKYNLVDMTRQGGLGEITHNQVQVSSGRLTEKLTAVPHANGRDTWVLVHGWQTNTFYAYLLTAAGLQPPVATNIGAVHSGGGGVWNNSNSLGYMRVSPDGRKLAVGIWDQGFELSDFSTTTGQLSNYVPLTSVYQSYGVEFSRDSRLLYGTNYGGLSVFQYDLQAGSASAIANSGIQVGSTSNYLGAIQAGPDGKLYLSVVFSSFLAVIDNPSVRGTGCGFRTNGVYLGNASSQTGLPNYPTVYSASFTGHTGCVGSAIPFASTVQLATNSTVATWNFGDPASGSANMTTGLTPTHTYATAGSYQVTLTVTPALPATPLIVTQAVTVYPLPTVSLGADTLVCSSAVWTLRTSPQPVGTLYRWQDGSTTAIYVAHGPGLYSVEVRAPATGCSATASLRASAVDCPVFIPNIITPNGDSQNEFFILKGLTASDWHLRVFNRWGQQVYNQPRYDNRWNASGQADGLYYYLLDNTTSGERHRGWIEVVRGG
jgi:gliding motility-associated-like protein